MVPRQPFEIVIENSPNEEITIERAPIDFRRIASTSVEPRVEETKPKKKKTTKTLPSGAEIVTVEDTEDHTSSRVLGMVETNASYGDTYDETSALLRNAVGQIDQIAGEVKHDLDTVRASKTIKGKYVYIPQLANTLSSLMSTKITAIREMNSSISQAHNLELKRLKDLNTIQSEKKNDDGAILDMYNAFISTPGGTQAFNAPSIMDITGGYGVYNSPLGDSAYGYQQYQQNMTPVLKTMRYESDPNIKTVVVYDRSSGRRWFDVMDLRTGASIPDVERPDNMFLEDTMIDVNNMIARNTNLDTTYKLIVVGNDGSLEKY